MIKDKKKFWESFEHEYDSDSGAIIRRFDILWTHGRFIDLGSDVNDAESHWLLSIKDNKLGKVIYRYRYTFTKDHSMYGDETMQEEAFFELCVHDLIRYGIFECSKTIKSIETDGSPWTKKQL